MDAPLVSIVIPNFDLADYLGEAIASALAQTHPRTEVIVVDDGSRDRSLEVARSFEGVTVIAKENGGVARARNAGADVARGDYLMFLDGDDVLVPTYVERTLAALRKAPSHVGYAYTQMELFGTETGLFESMPFDPRQLLVDNYVHCAALVRRAAFEHVGRWNPAFRVGLEDYELWLRMLAHGYHGTFVAEPLLRYRRRGESRNTFGRRKGKRLRTQLILSQPRLFLPEIARHPLATLYGLVAARVDPL